MNAHRPAASRTWTVFAVFALCLVAAGVCLAQLAATATSPAPAQTQPATAPQSASQPTSREHADAQSKPASAPATPAASGSPRWEPNIARFEERDKKSPPPAGTIVFVGSSSIAMWDTKKYFPDLQTIQRGFGGSEIADSTFYADRIVIPYKPRIVVFYAGDNDLAAGRSPRQALADFAAFAAKVHGALSETRIVYISIKPSVARWSIVAQVRKANALIEAFTKTDPRLAFLDVDTPMIGEDGRPRKELLREDGLHLTHEGYVLWSSLLRPYLTDEATSRPATAADWLTPRIMECCRGGQVTVRVRLPEGASVVWDDMPDGIADGEWNRSGDEASSTLIAAADCTTGMKDLTASVFAGDAATPLSMKLDVTEPLTIESEPFMPGQPVKVKLISNADEELAVTINAPAGPLPQDTVQLSPRTERTIGMGVPATTAEPVELTASLPSGVTITHWMRPGWRDVPHVKDIEINANVNDWPAAANLGWRAAERDANRDVGRTARQHENAPREAILLGWTSDGLYLYVIAPATRPQPADAANWWRGPNVELFLDTTDRPLDKWPQGSARQFYFIPVRDGDAWQVFAGENVREDGKATTRPAGNGCRAAINVYDSGWAIEAFIPAAALGAAPSAGPTWRGLVSVANVQDDGQTRQAGWPRLKPKDPAASRLWGELRFVEAKSETANSKSETNE